MQTYNKGLLSHGIIFSHQVPVTLGMGKAGHYGKWRVGIDLARNGNPGVQMKF